MKTQFGMTRFANKISSKDKKRPKNYQSKQNYRFVDRELSDKECADWGINRKPIEGESEDFSACFGDAILMENYGESPGIFSGKSPDYEGSLRWSFFGEPGLSNSSTGGFVMRLERGRLERLLAKIAHSYAVHVLGIDGFTPYLPKFILEHTLKSNRYLIGSAEAKTTQALHRIQIFRANAARLKSAYARTLTASGCGLRNSDLLLHRSDCLSGCCGRALLTFLHSTFKSDSIMLLN